MQESDLTICCRWAPSLGALEDSHEKVWGTKSYDPATDLDLPCVFFGMYGLSDFLALQKHRGKKWILWAGSDIRHLRDGYWLDTEGKVRIDPNLIAPLLAQMESYTENMVEHLALFDLGISSEIVPSFLGDVHAFPISYQPSDRPKLYTSVSGNDFKLYGWDKIPSLAVANPDIEFHCYGNTVYPWPMGKETDEIWSAPNVILHGRVTKQCMNEQIAQMQGALRLTEFDGFSEILAKSVLMGQYPVSLINYPYMLGVDQIAEIGKKIEPNVAGREYYQKELNQYPWNTLK